MAFAADRHANRPYDKNKKYWGRPTPHEEANTFVDELRGLRDVTGYLDDLLDSDYRKAKDINRALLALPADELVTTFGLEVAVWVVANSTFFRDNEDVVEVLESRYSYDPIDLETSRLWEWNIHSNSKAKSISANYRLMQDVKRTALQDIDLEKILVESAKPGITLSQKRLAEYALIPLDLGEYNSWSPGGYVKGWSNDISDTMRYDMWLDAPVGYALTYRGLPNAMAGIALKGTDELMLYQIQGVRGSKIDPAISRFSKERVIGKIPSRGLVPIDWQKVLVSTAESLGRNRGIRQLGIQAGRNNHWVKSHDGQEPHITLDTAERTYDLTAQRLGFCQLPDDDKQDWHKSL